MYADLQSTLVASLKAVPGIQDAGISEPRSIGVSPYAYALLMDVTRTHPGNGVTLTYHTRIRVLVVYDETEAAEAQIAIFVNTVPPALETLGKLLPTITAGFYTIDGRTFRALELTVESVEFLPFGAG